MKKLILILISIFMINCCSKPEIITIISEDDTTEYFALADSAAIVLVKKLGGRLTETIQKDGVIDAIDVCHKEAYKITDDLVDSFDKIISIKRVSKKFRNPKNAPDKYEIEALAWFENKIVENQVLPKSFGQKIVHKKKQTILYYKPMIMQTKCLLCHGDAEARLPDVSKRIDKHYPDDRAIDYQEGDFRGLIRVEIRGEIL